MTKQVYANTLAVIKMIEQLQEGASVAEIVQETGLHTATVRRWVRHFHRAGMVRISGYEKCVGGQKSIRIWRWGEGRDAPRRPQTWAERYQKVKARRQERMMQEALHA